MNTEEGIPLDLAFRSQCREPQGRASASPSSPFPEATSPTASAVEPPFEPPQVPTLGVEDLSGRLQVLQVRQAHYPGLAPTLVVDDPLDRHQVPLQGGHHQVPHEGGHIQVLQVCQPHHPGQTSTLVIEDFHDDHRVIQEAHRRHGAQQMGHREPAEIPEAHAGPRFSQPHQPTRMPSTQQQPLLDLGEEIQWRPPQSSEERIATMFDRSVARLARSLQPQTTHRPQLPTFSGTIWEDPQRFISDLVRSQFASNMTEHELTQLVSDQLRNEAYTWYQEYRHLDLSFGEFSKRFQAKYNSPAIRCRLQAQLYGLRQGNEDTAVFITQKLALFRRLAPEVDGWIEDRGSIQLRN